MRIKILDRAKKRVSNVWKEVGYFFCFLGSRFLWEYRHAKSHKKNERDVQRKIQKIRAWKKPTQPRIVARSIQRVQNRMVRWMNVFIKEGDLSFLSYACLTWRCRYECAMTSWFFCTEKNEESILSQREYTKKYRKQEGLKCIGNFLYKKKKKRSIERFCKPLAKWMRLDYFFSPSRRSWWFPLR